MQIRNEIRIFVQNKEFVFHNTITKNGTKAICSLKEYGKFLAIGTGRSALNGEEGFASLHSVWETQIEDKNFDISKGDLYLVRSAEIVPICDIEISELGLLCYDRSAKDLFNYVLIVDENGENTTIKLEAKKSVRVSVKIVLELSPDSVFFFKSNNTLVGALLGSGAITENTKFFLLGGANMAPNNSLQNIPLFLNPNEGKFEAFAKLKQDENGKFCCVFECEQIFEKHTSFTELILFVEDEPVARFNMQTQANEIEIERLLTSSRLGTIDFGFHINEIQSLQKVQEDALVDVSNYSLDHQVFDGFGYSISVPYNDSFNHALSRFVSSSGKTILFYMGGQPYVYRFENMAFTQIASYVYNYRGDVTKFVLNENILIVQGDKTQMNFDLYEFENNVMVRKFVDHAPLYNTLGSISFKHIDLGFQKNGNFSIGAIIDDGQNTGLFLEYEKKPDGSYAMANYALKMNNCEQVVVCPGVAPMKDTACVFFTNNYNNAGIYRAEINYGTTAEVFSSQSVLAALMQGTIKAYAGFLTTQYSNGKQSKILYYLPGFTRFIFSLEDDNSYLIHNEFGANFAHVDKENGLFKFYHLAQYSNLRELGSFPYYSIPEANIIDVVFLNNAVLIFANMQEGNLFLVQMPEMSSRILNLEPNTIYKIKAKAQNHIGTEFEKAKVNFEIKLELVEGV